MRKDFHLYLMFMAGASYEKGKHLLMKNVISNFISVKTVICLLERLIKTSQNPDIGDDYIEISGIKQ